MGIKNFPHRRKITFKCREIILFGLQRCKTSLHSSVSFSKYLISLQLRFSVYSPIS